MSRPLVLHLTSYDFTPRSHPGIFRTVLCLAPHARSVVLCQGAGRYADEPLTAEERTALAEHDVHVHEISRQALYKPFATLELLAGLRRRYGRPLAVLGHLGNNGWRALALGRFARAPVVTVFHGTDATVDAQAEETAWRFQQLFGSPGARQLTVAAHLAERLVRAGARPEATHPWHLPMDLDGFRPSPAAAPAERIALVGRLVPVKGHRTAFDAIKLMARTRPGVRLHLFGEGPLEAELRERVDLLDLERHVSFEGAVPIEALKAAVGRCDVVIQPSERHPDGMIEGVPNGTLEAMALARPVVATRHGGIPEAVLDGQTGVLVGEGDAGGLAAALGELLDHPERARALGEAGRRHVEAEFSPEGQGQALAAHLTEAGRAYGAVRGRRAAWARATEGIVEPWARTGRREQVRWWRRIAARRLDGALPEPGAPAGEG